MATPVGHMLAGGTIAAPLNAGNSLFRRIGIGALLAAAPDLDFIPGLIVGDPARFHHGISHSLGVAVLVACATWLIASSHRWRWALVAGSSYVSHLLLDALTVDPSLPRGMPLLWPLTETYLMSPVTPLPRVLHSSESVINLHNFGVAFLELIIFGLLLWLCVRHELSRSER